MTKAQKEEMSGEPKSAALPVKTGVPLSAEEKQDRSGRHGDVVGS